MEQANITNYISEGNLYRLICRSKLESAERFEYWVFEDVLPSIRKHGAYIVPELLSALNKSEDRQKELIAELEAEIREICRSKFSTWEWNFGQSPKAQFRKALRLPCGTVEASCSIVRGGIAGLAFGGDFIGSLPAEGIAAALEGCRFERAAVLEALRGLDAGRCFDGTSPEQLADLFTVDTPDPDA